MAGLGPDPQRSRERARHVAVPADVAGLAGPLDGVIFLPLSLYSSGLGPARPFDLSEEAQRIELYEIVITGGSATDMRRYLNGGELMRLWPRLWLPAAVRRTWEPMLASARA